MRLCTQSYLIINMHDDERLWGGGVNNVCVPVPSHFHQVAKYYPVRCVSGVWCEVCEVRCVWCG